MYRVALGCAYELNNITNLLHWTVGLGDPPLLKSVFTGLGYLLEVESFQRGGARRGHSDLLLFKGDVVTYGWDTVS